jgi:hypothetical protein
MIESANPPEDLGIVPLSTGNVTHDDLTVFYGPTAFDQGVTFSSLTEDGHLYLFGDWVYQGIKTGVSVVIFNENVRKKFSVKRIDRIENGDLTRLTLSVKDPLDLTSFIGTSGFSSIDSNVKVMLFQGVLNYTDTEYFSGITYKRTSIGTTGYNVKISWKNSPEVYKSTLRWRRKPEILLSGTVSYVIAQGGTYTEFPEVTLLSSTGYGESVILTGSLTGFSAFGGTGYTSSPTIVFSGGGGTGAIATCVGLSGQIVSVSMLSGGTGYSELPSFSISGGSGATVSFYLRTSNVQVVEKGVNYFTSPQLSITGGSGTGLSAYANVNFYSESTPDDDWSYYSATGMTMHEIVGFTKGIRYEVQLYSRPENFNDLGKLSASLEISL